MGDILQTAPEQPKFQGFLPRALSLCNGASLAGQRFGEGSAQRCHLPFIPGTPGRERRPLASAKDTSSDRHKLCLFSGLRQGWDGSAGDPVGHMEVSGWDPQCVSNIPQILVLLLAGKIKNFLQL